MYLFALLLGGALAVTLLGLLIGLAFKRTRPHERALRATLGALVVAGILAGFGMADGGNYRYDAIIFYIPGALIAFVYLRWHYGRGLHLR